MRGSHVAVLEEASVNFGESGITVALRHCC
jgi:hypothetical protein